MKKSIRNVLCCGALFASLTLTSCGSVDPAAIKSVKVTGGEETVYQYNPYQYDNLKLEVTKNNGEVAYVNVDESMITRRIDSNATGKQKLEITYNGKKYVLTVNVQKSPAADALFTKIQGLLASVTEDAKEAESVTFRIKINAGQEYFASKMGTNATGEPVKTLEVTFTKDQINNGELTKALTLLQLSLQRGNIITETTEDGPKVYANIDMPTFVDGMIEIAAKNSGYFRQLLINGGLNFVDEDGYLAPAGEGEGWEGMFAAMLAGLQAQTGIGLNAKEMELAIFDAFSFMLKGASAVKIGNVLVSEIFTETTIAALSNFIASGIESSADVEIGSTRINNLVMAVMTQIVDMFHVDDEEEVDAETVHQILDEEELQTINYLDRDILTNIIDLGFEIGVTFGADPEELSNALNTITQKFEPVKGVMEILDSFGVFEVYDYDYDEETGEDIKTINTDNTNALRGAMFNLGKQIDNAIVGEEAYIFSAIIDIVQTIYSFELDDEAIEEVHNGLDDEGEGEEAEPIVDLEADPISELLRLFDELALEIDNMLNGNENFVVTKLVNAVQGVDQLIQGHDMLVGAPEEIYFVGMLISEYLVPQVTEENIQSIADTIVSMQTMTDEQKLETIKQGLINFANTEDTKAFVNFAVTNAVAGMLEDDLRTDYVYDEEADQTIDANENVVYDSSGAPQPFVFEIAENVYNCIYGEIDFVTTISNINDILSAPELANKFYDTTDVIKVINSFLVGFTKVEPLTEEERMAFAISLSTMLNVEFVPEPEAVEEDGEEVGEEEEVVTNEQLGMEAVLNFADQIREIWLNADEEVSQAQKILDILRAGEAMFDSEYIELQTSAMLVSFMASNLDEALNSEDGNIHLFTNLVNAAAKVAATHLEDGEEALAEFNAEKTYALKLAEIIDYVDEWSEEEIALNIVQFVSLPDFAKITSEFIDIPESVAQMVRILAYVALDVPGIDYNELMADFNTMLPEEDQLPADWAQLDYNEFVAYLRTMDLGNIVNIHDVKIDFAEDENGDINKQTAQFLAEFNLNILAGETVVYKANADFSFEIELNYDAPEVAPEQE